MSIDRRSFVVGLPLFIGGCATDQPLMTLAEAPTADPYYESMYAAIDTEPFPVPAIDLTEIEPQFLRQEVSYKTTEPPGTLVVDPNARFLYLVGENGRALRYGVGVGKVEAFNFQGAATIARKAEWPRWTPTRDMIRANPIDTAPSRTACPAGRAIPSARARSIFTRMARTRFTACTERLSPGRSGRKFHPAAFVS
jgi:lipoprotein-anchoring transpeptidase ErfK/SrfK